jgi:hypothetical protein
MTAGRSVTRWIRFGIDDSAGAPREIPIDSLSPVGFSYPETDVSAWQDAVKGYLADQPDAAIDITGPFDISTAVGLAASAAAPTLSGSHTILAPISALTFTTPLGLWIGFGIRGYWTTGDPAFGIVAPSATSGYVCTKYQVEGNKYSARFVPYPGSTPAWGSAIIT